MSVKKIILYIAIFLVVLASTVAVLYVLNVGKTTTYSRGILPTDETTFGTVAGASGVPLISELPAERNGWKKITSSSETTYAYVQLSRDDGCRFDVTTQLLPNTDKDKNDFQLSRAVVDTSARSVEGVASDPYVLSLQSKQGNVEFYTAVYNPTLVLVPSMGTTPTNQGGSKRLDGSHTTFIAVRVIGKDVTIGENDSESRVADGIVTLGSMLPAAVITYTCPTSQFDVNDPLGLLADLTLDFANTTQIVPATSGK